ncbi:olfactory receptor 51E2-like [Harpia harpyja]|uniref:olfactory receptor 51E2-like n=1 Tax=Harpia harpyja TaxID=202280 RepID=UPI0022B0F247|nr:olfactory receptor 51E2-like [Harpia harpyja]
MHNHHINQGKATADESQDHCPGCAQQQHCAFCDGQDLSQTYPKLSPNTRSLSSDSELLQLNELPCTISWPCCPLLCLPSGHIVLGIFWFKYREINCSACFPEIFFTRSLLLMEMSMLLLMALGSFEANHNLLQTPPGSRGKTEPSSPLPLPFCSSRVLSHSFCLHQDVMNLACANTTPSVVYGLTAILLVMGLDAILICLSYILILKAVLQLASWKERLKVFSACVAHICVVLAFYVPLIGLSVVHRFGKDLAPLVHIIMGNIYILVPAVLNPIIYGVRTKQIQRIQISIKISDDRSAH